MKKLYTVTMENGDVYGIPAEVVAKNYANHYKQWDSEDYDQNFAVMMSWFDTDDFEFADWAKNNMDWDEVKEYAELICKVEKPVDFQEGWVNGEYEYLVQEE